LLLPTAAYELAGAAYELEEKKASPLKQINDPPKFDLTLINTEVDEVGSSRSSGANNRSSGTNNR
jgi:hypothetical protein